MRKFLLFMLCLAAPGSIFCQGYLVTVVKGKVLYKKKLLQALDRIDDFNALYPESPDAQVGLLSPKTGMHTLTFERGKAINQKEQSRRSELFYRLILDKTKPFNETDLLGTKGLPFYTDPKAYYKTPSRHEDTNFASNKWFLIIDNETFKINTTTYPLNDQHYFILRFKSDGSEGAIKQLPHSKDTLFLHIDLDTRNAADTQFQCAMLYRYDEQHKFYYEKVADVNAYWMPQQHAKKIITAMARDLKTFYKNDRELIINAIILHFEYYYGTLNRQQVRLLLTETVPDS